MVNFLQAFWQATRPRTYPLAVAGIIVANALAYSRIGSFNSKNWQIFLLSLWVALGLQILSNLANDYGDGIRGTDAHRLDRQTAQGTINPKTFKKLIISWALFIFGCGIGLLWLSFNSLTDFFTFLALGIIAIIAAVTYTMGKNPYGYNAKGEIAVFLFFGLVNVLGGVYLQTQFIRVRDIIAAVVIGLLCTCVLMINNMRDFDTDTGARKNTLTTTLGKESMSHLYRFMLLGAYFLLITFATLRQNFYLLSLLVLVSPIAKHLKMVRHYSDENIPSKALAPELPKIVLITLATSVLMSVSILIFNYKKLI